MISSFASSAAIMAVAVSSCVWRRCLIRQMDESVKSSVNWQRPTEGRLFGHGSGCPDSACRSRRGPHRARFLRHVACTLYL